MVADPPAAVPPGDSAFRSPDLRTHWPEMTYGGAVSFLRRRYGRDLTGVDVAVMGVPYDASVTYRPGCRLGPRAIRAASVQLAELRAFPFGFDLMEELSILDWGDCFVDPHHPETVAPTIRDTAAAIIGTGTRMLTLGGDHFIAWPLLAAHAERHGPLALIQVDADPQLWREQLDLSAAAHQAGSRLYPQVAARPFGMLLGFPGHHAFTHRPTYRALKASCDREELAARLAEPAVRQAILSEEDLPIDPNVLFDGMFALAQYSGDRLYSLGEPPDYEPTRDKTVAAIAADRGQDVLAAMYDLMLEADASNMLMLPMFNYADGNHDAIREMMTHPAGVLGLSDGGAHCSMICDASYPTFLLTHWARDRHRGEKLPLEYVVRKQSHDTAQLFGLTDRGVIQTGKKADLNVIDLHALTLHAPRMAFDLPAGGHRLVQGASGYTATIVNGVITRRDGVDTGKRPGRLLRGTR